MTTIQTLDRPIAFQRPLVTVTGCVTGALLLSQAIYWQNRCKSDDGWWWKTAEEWEEEAGLTRHELATARKACSGILLWQRKGLPCKTFYKVDADKLDEAIKSAGIRQTGHPESGQLDSRNPANIITETTTETTTESKEGEPAEPDLGVCVVSAWNELSEQSGLSGVRCLSVSRKKSLSARLREPFFRENWLAAIQQVATSAFLTGNNDRGWKADFDWFLQPDAVIKIMEGKYHRKGPNGHNGHVNGSGRKEEGITFIETRKAGLL